MGMYEQSGLSVGPQYAADLAYRHAQRFQDYLAAARSPGAIPFNAADYARMFTPKPGIMDAYTKGNLQIPIRSVPGTRITAKNLSRPSELEEMAAVPGLNLDPAAMAKVLAISGKREYNGIPLAM